MWPIRSVMTGVYPYFGVCCKISKKELDLQESCCSPDLRNAFISWKYHSPLISRNLFSAVFFFAYAWMQTMYSNIISYIKCLIHLHINRQSLHTERSLLLSSFVQHRVTVGTSAGNRQPDCECSKFQNCSKRSKLLHWHDYPWFYLTYFCSYILYRCRYCFFFP